MMYKHVPDQTQLRILIVIIFKLKAYQLLQPEAVRGSGNTQGLCKLNHVGNHLKVLLIGLAVAAY